MATDRTDRKVVPLESTGDARVDAQFRRTAQAFERGVGVPTEVGADSDGKAKIRAPEIEWTPSGATAFGVDERQALEETTDGAAKTLMVFEIPAGRLCRFSAVVTGRRAGNGDAYATRVEATFKRGSGAASQVGATTVLATHNDGGAAAWAVTFDTSSTLVRLRVTGQAGATVRWSGTLRAQTVG
jgi:hypothetical protein